MSIKSLIKSSLRGKISIFLSMGFMVVFVWVVGLEPVKAQKKRDTVVQEDTVAPFVDVEPEYPGGMKALYAFLGENTVYPKEAQDAKYEGTTQLKFIIDKYGVVDSVTILRSSGYEVLDDEAVRVVKSMPKWIPGKVNGKPVATYYRIPIRFQLSKEEKK